MASPRPVRLPTAMEYRDALQAPDLAFLDRELRGGRPVLDRLGLPRASSGNFAAVFHVRCLLRQYAVRCFLRSTEGMHERYRLISGALEGASATVGRWTVGFEYVSEGVRVGDAVYPLIKMEWVDGTQLHTYVRANLGRPDKIYELAGLFLTMMCDLRQSGLAHGDLQHGNILVTRAGGLKLVDYDCMFTPLMAGQWAPEVGHSNYQHPQRAAEHFDPSLDDFSSWVIYVSLVALTYAPKLWSMFDGGDECLFLRKKDFLHPESSEVISAMRAAISEVKFQEMLDAFIWILGRDPDAVLPLPPIGRPRPIAAGPPALHRGRDERGCTPAWMENKGGGPRLDRFGIRGAVLPGFGAGIVFDLEQTERSALIRVDGEEIGAPGFGDYRAAQPEEWRGDLVGPPLSTSEESAAVTADSSPAVVPASPEQQVPPPAPVGGTSGSQHNPVASPPAAQATHTSLAWEKWMVVVVALAVCSIIAVVIIELFVLYSIMNLM